MYHSHLFVAGTFEGLHAGHRFLLSQAFVQGQEVTIGLTTDEFVKKFKISRRRQSGYGASATNFKFQIGKYKARKKALEELLKRQKKQATIIPIDDPCEPAASMEDLDAIVVTPENRKRGEEINEIRLKRSLSPLALIEVPMVSAEDGRPVSSTRVRNGEIDHNGRLVMPEFLRAVLGKPMGKIVQGPAKGDAITIAVGDIATKTFLDEGTRPFLAIIDGKVGRKPYPSVISQLRKTTSCEAKSGPGFISREAIEAIERCFASYVLRPTSYVLLIDGEEDLLVLPAVLYAPIGAVVYYGQPGEGLVEVVVTKAKKRQALAFIAQFLS